MRKPTLLTIYLGSMFDDFDKVEESLKQLNINYIICNILNPSEFKNVITLLRQNKIDAIETRNVRYWQENFDKFQLLFEKIVSLARKNKIPMMNSPELFKWVGNKANYFSYFKKAGIPIIPTKFLIPDESFDIVDYIKNKNDGLVIKPSFAAKAFGLEFIQPLPSRSRYLIEIPQQSSGARKAHLKKITLTAEGLRKHFASYLNTFRNTPLTKNQIILVQDFVSKKIEISCILIRDCQPYYIKRTEGQYTKIAHEAFGGKNILLNNPSKKLKKFIHNILEKLPKKIKNETMLRFDILECSNDEILLSEVEASSLRLFTIHDNLKHYAKMLSKVTKKSYNLLIKNGKRLNTVTDTLTPSLHTTPGMFKF